MKSYGSMTAIAKRFIIGVAAAAKSHPCVLPNHGSIGTHNPQVAAHKQRTVWLRNDGRLFCDLFR